jgi:5'-nucleotidase
MERQARRDRPLRVLLTNDDGIAAPGLLALYNEMKTLGEAIVIAPDSERSAVGHAITISDPLRVSEYHRNGRFYGYAVSGTPADCVKLAYWSLLDEKPDLVVSGINRGSNTGINVIYSGTVSAATEATILGIPSFAISLATFENPDFTYAAKFARRLARVILHHDLPQGTFLNVNVPPVPEDQIEGVVISRQGLTVYDEKFEKRLDPQNRVYYWLTGVKREIEDDPTVDDRAVLDRKVSITPIHYDLTNYHFMEELKTWNIHK